jgi:hypothetical protein
MTLLKTQVHIQPHYFPEVKLFCDRWSVSQLVLVSSHHLGPETIMSLPWKLSSNSCGYFIMGRPLM